MAKSRLVLIILGLLGFVSCLDHAVCKEFQCSDISIFGKSCTYCCKDCCVLTITNAAGCEADLCNSVCSKTHGVDKDQCVLKTIADSRGNEIPMSIGCDSN